MKIVTWNVNGIRAREAQVLELLDREAPGPGLPPGDQGAGRQGAGLAARAARVPRPLARRHGLLRRGAAGARGRVAAPPAFVHPPFDFETRAVAAEVGGVTVACLYVPNGGKDFDAKLRFLEALDGWAAEAAAAGRPLLLCGDLNVTATDVDVHPKERRDGAIGQRADERALLRGSLCARARRRGAGARPGQRRPSSPGGRPGAGCARRTSAGASTTWWPAGALAAPGPPLPRAGRVRHQRPRAGGERVRGLGRG